MSTRSSKQKHKSSLLLSPFSRWFGSHRSSKRTSRALDDSFTIVDPPQADSHPQRRGRSSSLGDLRPHPAKLHGRQETFPGYMPHHDSDSVPNFSFPQVSSPAQIEDVASTPTSPIESPTSGKSHLPLDSGNSVSFFAAVDQIAANPKTRRQTIDDLLQQAGHIAEGSSDGQTGEMVEAGVATLANTVPVIMDVLDAVATIHPAIKVVVVAVQGAYKLQCARSENDKRIKVLDLQMKDMLRTFVLLADVRDPSDITRISSQVNEVARRAAKDIEGYSACTDLYLNQRLVLRVLMSPLWEQRLFQFVSDFADRRKEIADALSLCSARGISKLQQDMQMMEKRTVALMDFFKLNIPTNEAKVKSEVEKKGGRQELLTRGDNQALHEINKIANNLEGSGTGRKVRGSELTLEGLLTELRMGFEESIKQHMKILDGKINLQEPSSGGLQVKDVGKKEFMYERIADPDLSIIWKEMNPKRLGDSIGDLTPMTDEWALPYIDIKWLQPIVESFDEDGSGYVTIAEINNFTQSRPTELGWSLRQWIAYWAIGWRITMTRYRELAQLYMRDIYITLQSLLPINNNLGDIYFYTLWSLLSRLVVSPPAWDIPDDLIDKFDKFVKLEQDRIAANLEKLSYNIDAPNTVNMIVGSGARVEKHVFPLIYLVLKQHATLIHRGTTEVLSRDEISSACNSLASIRSAVDTRVRGLTDSWEQQRLDPQTRLESFSWGIFNNLDADSMTISEANELSYLLARPSEDYWVGYLTRSLWEKEVEDLWKKYDLSTPGPSISQPVPRHHTSLDVEAYTLPDTSVPESLQIPDDLRSLLGRWSGFSTLDSTEDTFRRKVLYTFLFREPTESEIPSSSTLTFGSSNKDHMGDPCILSGVAKMTEDGSITVDFNIKYSNVRMEYQGHKVEGRAMVVGSWKAYHDDPTFSSVSGSFSLLQVSEDVMDLLLSPRVLVWNRARLLWHLAIEFAKRQVKRRTWKALHERRMRRKQFLRLVIKASVTSYIASYQTMRPISAMFVNARFKEPV
ncbi:hypothetical protein NLI96_g5521 [Meripilus lineatus]|uniref:EF-hand domain-containing protein n=1 Tax=Meripilus lineatus TaxID=2056292 RepID=A0AAD5V4Q7_9APHY|nr:hypothetical protein NLI96_g5521 [Physisporinus lineatus]